MKRLSTEVHARAVQGLSDGKSTRAIARELKICHSSVSNIRRTMSPQPAVPKSGPMEKLTERDRRSLVRSVTSGACDTSGEMRQDLIKLKGVSVSGQTIRNALKKEGMKAVRKKKRPLLTARHRRLRLMFATKYKSWTLADWRRVIFTDETKINRAGSDGLKWAWKKAGQGISNAEVASTLKFGGGSLMLWGCMTSKGVGFACRIDGRMDAQLYTEILGGEFLQTLSHYDLNIRDIIFQQDNDPKHTSKLATSWFQANGIELLDWPPQSPDLNPIEHLWAHLKRRLSSYENIPEGIHELWTRVEQEWEGVSTEVCLGLIDSMPRRISAVLKAKGGFTKY